MDYGATMCTDLVESGEVSVLHFYTLNLEKVVYGILDTMGVTHGALDKVNEKDAATQMAVGSAWARVGDNVTSVYGSGIVEEIRKDGTTIVVMDKWQLAGGQKPRAYLQKGSFQKV